MTEKSYAAGSEFPPLESGKLRIYSMRFCPFAQRTRLVLEHKKIPYETVNIDLKQKPSWFLKRNPLGLVPTLEKDDKIVYESLICGDYLDDVHSDNSLTPSDPYRKARDRILTEGFNKVNQHRYKIVREQGEARDEAVEAYLASLEQYEVAIGERGKFFGGDQPTMLDYNLWPWFERQGAFTHLAPDCALTTDRFPKLNAWIKNMEEVPAVRAVAFDTASHIHFTKSYMAGKPDYDYGL